MLIKILIILATLLIYKLSLNLRKIKYVDMIPPSILCALIIYLLISIFQIDFSAYNEGGKFFTFLLGPAIIALSVPLIKNIKVLEKNYQVIIVAVLSSTIFAILSVISVAFVFSATKDILLSMIAKSVTTAVAIEITKILGGKVEIIVLITALSGMFGAIFGHWILRTINVKNNLAIGIAIGFVSHVLGTAKCYEVNKLQAGVSSVTLVLSSITTAILAPPIVKLIF
ncbi:MAG: LrgB family protein [Endomicrobiaceae bacterium]|nr:LrgB family protein [Endomicrobiaceae bacterium]